jgi:hypothetical protein
MSSKQSNFRDLVAFVALTVTLAGTQSAYPATDSAKVASTAAPPSSATTRPPASPATAPSTTTQKAPVADTPADAVASESSAADSEESDTPVMDAPGTDTKGTVVCFKLTMRCLKGKDPNDPSAAANASSGGASGSAKNASAAAKGKPTATTQSTTAANAASVSKHATSGTATSQQPLNLTTPDVKHVVSEDELKEPLPDEEQQAESQDTETVQVKAKSDAPEVPSGFEGVWWAMKHPLDAWRLFSPAQ